MWLPDGSAGEEPASKAGDQGIHPGLGRSPGGGHGNPLQYSCLENPMDRGAWWNGLWGHKELDITEVTEHSYIHTYICLFICLTAPSLGLWNLRHMESLVAGVRFFYFLFLKLWHMRSSSLTRNWAWPPAWGTQSLSHWTTREVPPLDFWSCLPEIPCWQNNNKPGLFTPESMVLSN